MSLDQPTQFVIHQTISRDAFLGGRLTLSQPRHGFRAGQDSVLLGAAVPEGVSRLLDLGAGVGTAGLVALELGLAASVDLAERDQPTLSLAEANVVDNRFSGRAHILNVDITAPADARRAAGLFDNGHDCVIANPPYFREGQGTLAADGARAHARHMQADGLDPWVRRAAGCAAASGQAIFIYPAEGLVAMLSAMQNRFGALTVLPLASRPGQPAHRILVRGIKGARSPLTLLPARALHGSDGHAFAPEFDAIFHGRAALDW